MSRAVGNLAQWLWPEGVFARFPVVGGEAVASRNQRTVVIDLWAVGECDRFINSLVTRVTQGRSCPRSVAAAIVMYESVRSGWLRA